MRKLPFLLVFILFGNGWLYAAAPKNAPSSSRDLCKQNFDFYRDRLRKNPEDSQGWAELRVCAELLKRWGEAGAIASAAIHKNPERPEPHLILGQAAYNAKDYNQAADELRESIRLKNDQPPAYFQLGLAYLHLNQVPEAVKAGVRAIELDPTNSAYHRQLAFSYYMINEDEKCATEAKKALEIDANDVASYKILSNLYARQGHQELADQMMVESIHANGRIAKTNPFVPDKKLTEADMPHPFQESTPVADAEVFLKAQWEKMKVRALAGDVEAAAAYYSTVDGTRDVYRESFKKMGPDRMKMTFGKLGELSDCEVDGNQAHATCRCPVNASSGTLLETKVRFMKDPDATWRIKSF